MKAAAFIFLYLLAYSAFGQYETLAPVTVGVRSGINSSILTRYYSTYELKSDKRTGMQIGAFAEFPLTRSIGVRSVIDFTSLGGGFTFNNIPQKNTINYANVIALGEYYVYHTGLSFFAGPQLALLISAKRKTPTSTIKTRNEYTSRNFGLIGGAEYSFPSGITFSMAYQYGITDMTKTLKNIETRTTVLSFTVNWKIWAFY